MRFSRVSCFEVNDLQPQPHAATTPWLEHCTKATEEA